MFFQETERPESGGKQIVSCEADARLVIRKAPRLSLQEIEARGTERVTLDAGKPRRACIERLCRGQDGVDG